MMYNGTLVVRGTLSVKFEKFKGRPSERRRP